MTCYCESDQFVYTLSDLPVAMYPGGELRGELEALCMASRLSSVLSEDILGSLWYTPCWLIVPKGTFHLLE